MKIVERLKQLVGEERRIIAEAVLLLLEVEDKKVYAKFGHSSVFDFCVRELGHSEGSAYRRVSAMRLQRRDPRCVEKLATGELSLSNAARVESALREAQRKNLTADPRTLLEAVIGLTSRQAEIRLNEIVPQDKPVQLSLSLEEKIQKLRALLPRHLQGGTKEEILHYLLDGALERLVPPQGDIAGEVRCPRKRHIPKKLRAAIFARDKHRCTYPGCQATEFLEVDHIKPFAHGGRTVAENLRVLCHTHNLLEAERNGLRRPSTAA